MREIIIVLSILLVCAISLSIYLALEIRMLKKELHIVEKEAIDRQEYAMRPSMPPFGTLSEEWRPAFATRLPLSGKLISKND